MSYYAVDGRVTQRTLEGAIEISEEQYHAALAGIAKGHVVTIDGGFSVGPKVEPEPTEPEPKPGPLTPEEELEQWRETASVSSRQGEQQLILAGLDEQVEAAISGIADETQRKLTRAWYQRAATWERTNPELKALGAALDLTDEQIDDLFKQASEL